MIKKEQNIKKGKKYLLIGVLVLFLAILGSSVAYCLARVSGSLSGNAAGTELTLNIEKISTSANDDLIPLDNDLETLRNAIAGYQNNGACVDINGYSVCQIYKVTVRNNGTVPLNITGGVQLVGANTPNIDCAKMDTNSTISSNNSCIGANTLANEHEIAANTSEDYYVLVYINNLDEPQYDKGSFNGTVSFVSTQGKRVKARFKDTYNAAEFLKEKFDNDANKENVDAADGVQYKYAKTESLMYDRLGGTTTELEDGNLRYYGASPNNYIDIGDTLSEGYVTQKNWEKAGFSFANSDECYSFCKNNWQLFDMESEAECNALIEEGLPEMGFESMDQLCKEETKYVREPILWRIIGVFEGNLKIIREETIGNYSWDTSPSNVNDGHGINEWSQADLMKLLNPGHEGENVGGSLYWNSESGTCYAGSDNTTTECDFSSSGLSEEAKDLIVDNLWYLGGINEYGEDDSFSKTYYALERGNNIIQYSNDGIARTTRWTGKVGLIYLSDFGYAVDLTSCNNKLNNYDNSACRNNNWFIMDNNNSFRSVTPNTSNDYNAVEVWGIGKDGSVGASPSSVYTSILPVLYLKKDLVIESGTGTKDDPYIAG